MTELEGFEIYKPEKSFFIGIGDKTIRICADAYRSLGAPGYLNVFIDEAGLRVMIKVAQENYENAMKVIAHSSGRNMCICYKPLAEKLAGMFGKGARVYGRMVSDDMMIFEG